MPIVVQELTGSHYTTLQMLESAVGADGSFRMSGALGLYDFLIGDLRIVRVTQQGREIPNGRIRVGSSETLTGIEVVVAAK